MILKVDSIYSISLHHTNGMQQFRIAKITINLRIYETFQHIIVHLRTANIF